jgi:predicted lipoprotein with Yx(FWY)xxD motif
MPTPHKSIPALHRRGATAVAALVALAATAAAVAAIAAAAGTTRVVQASHNQMLGETLVVDTHGRTLYALHPETVHHLLCKSHACFQFWPPLLVRNGKVKLRAGHGVQGHLALLHRAGKWQVTLRGMPLYRYAGDSASGEANGEGIKTFGGTWHALTAETHPAVPMQAPAQNTSTSNTPAPYGY